MPKAYLTALEILDNDRIDPAARISCVLFGEMVDEATRVSFLSDSCCFSGRGPKVEWWTTSRTLYDALRDLDADDVFEIGDVFLDGVDGQQWMVARLREYVAGQRQSFDDFVLLADDLDELVHN